MDMYSGACGFNVKKGNYATIPRLFHVAGPGPISHDHRICFCYRQQRPEVGVL